MNDLLNASPTPQSYGEEPFSISEIDAHPDRDRIWATLSAIKSAVDSTIADIEASGGAEIEASNDAGYDEAKTHFLNEIEEAIDEMDKGNLARAKEILNIALSS